MRALLYGTLLAELAWKMGVLDAEVATLLAQILPSSLSRDLDRLHLLSIQ